MCWFLPCINLSQPQVHTRPVPLECPSHPAPSHPSGSSQSTGCERPESQSKSPLAPVWLTLHACTRYMLARGSGHVQCHSLHSSCPLLPHFSMPVSPLLPCREAHQYHLPRFHIYVFIDGICFSLSDLLHSIQWALGSSTSLELIQCIFFYRWVMYLLCAPSLFIHSSVCGHLGCFQVLVIVSSAAVNVGECVSFPIFVFSGYMPPSGIVGSHGSFIPSFFKESPYCLP